MDGFVLLWRKLLDSEVWSDAIATRVFIWILLRVKWADQMLKFGNVHIQVKAGELFTCHSDAADEVHISVKQWRRALDRLEELEMVKRSQGRLGIVITLCNWRDYQMPEFVRGQTKGRPRADQGQALIRNKQKVQEVKDLRSEATLLAPSDSRSVPPSPPSDFVMILKDGKEWPVPQSDVDRWQADFPALDVAQTLRKIHSWTVDNVGKRKSGPAGMRRCITSWLTRDQDRGLGRNGATKQDDKSWMEKYR